MKPHSASGHNRQSSRKASRAGHLGKKPRRRVITASQFYDARVFSGLSRDQAAVLLGVSLRTIGHWETGRARPSYAAFKLLRVYRHGDLVHPAWADFSINRRGALVTPEGHELVAADLGWLSLLCRRAEAFSDLLRQRDRRSGEGADLAGGAQRPAPAPLALVSTETTHTSNGESLVLQGIPVHVWSLHAPVASPATGANMAPIWPHNWTFSPVPSVVNAGVRGLCPGSNTGQKSAHFAREVGA